jgi:hypothetical protein
VAYQEGRACRAFSAALVLPIIASLQKSGAVRHLRKCQLKRARCRHTRPRGDEQMQTTRFAEDRVAP